MIILGMRNLVRLLGLKCEINILLPTPQDENHKKLILNTNG